MDPMILGVIAGGTAALAMIVAQRRTTKRLELVPLLREHGPLTIPQLMAMLGLEGWSAQGRVVMALDALVRSGKVEEGKVSRTIPTIERINHRKYTLRLS
jgi:hypothetical protein